MPDKCCHLLHVVQVEVLQLKPVLEEDSADEPPGGDGEAALVEDHKRDLKSLGGGVARTHRREPSTPRWR
jgi:hypothetical protein